MNNEQLIQLLQDKTPEELSVEEIELLKSRLSESDELRSALFEQLEMEEYLATALGRVNVSVDSITGTRQDSGAGPHPMLLALVLVVCLGVIGLISLIVLPGLREQPDDVAQVTDDESSPADADDEEPPAVPNEEIDPPPADENDNPPIDEPDPPADEPEESDPPPVEEVTEPEPPQGPWVAGLGAPPQSFAATWFVDFDTTKRLPSQEDVQQWFANVKGQNVRFYEESIQNAKHGSFHGFCKLLAPLPEDAALRFSTAKADQLRIHCYRGDHGVSLYWNTRHGASDRWAAYTTTREAEQPTPATFQLTDTDEGRDEVCDARYGPTLMLFWHDGDLVLTRGDIELSRASFPDSPPEEIYFEGQASFRGIEMLRLTDLPAAPDAWPDPYEIVDRPADLEWQGELPEKATLEKRDDGSVRLAADNSPEFAWTAIALPTDRVRFVEVELDDVHPGAQIWLGPPPQRAADGAVTQKGGRPTNPTLAFALNDRDKRLAVDWKQHDAGRKTVYYHEIQEKPVPYVGTRTWVRFLVAAGWMRCWISSDGQQWALWNWGEPWYGDHMTHLGIGCAVNAPRAELTVRTIRYRELPAINGLVEAELRERAPGFPKETNLANWLIAVTQAQPAGIDANDWRTACAIRTLATGCPSKTMQALLDLLEISHRQQNDDPAEHLALLNELPELASLWEKLPNEKPIELHNRYLALGHALAASGELRPFTAIRRQMMTELPMARHFFKAFDAELIRYELLQLAYRNQWDDLAQFIAQLRFYAGAQLDQAVPIVPWLEILAAKQQPARLGDGVVRLESDWQNPLVKDYNKEAYSVMAEFHATVESEAYDDAAEMIAELDPYAMHGLVPAGGDDDLLVSVATGVRSAMNRSDELATIVNTAFAPLGKLRVRQATTVGDADAVRLATIQFHGTEAAGMAHRWLGDRALASGEFVTAMDEYRRATTTAGVIEKKQIEPRIRLAAAMMGLDHGEPITAPVSFGEVDMSADEFERLVQEMRSVHADSSGSLNSITRETLGDSPPPSGFQVHRRGRLDGHPGEDSGNIDGHVREHHVPWLSRQLGITIDRSTLYVNNRFHVAAYDLNSNGRRLWQSPPPPDRGKTRDWQLVSMRPVLTDRNIFVRQLSKSGPVLIALDRADGKHVWVTQPQKDEQLLSDPVLAHGKLFALMLRDLPRGDDMLRLVSFALETGEPIDSHDLINMRDSWDERRVCATTALPGGILACLGGFVMNVDFAGNVRWVREQLMVPADQESSWVQQRFDPPLIVGDRVIVASPGVRTVECLSRDYGELAWRSILPDVQRLVAVADGNAVVHAGDELIALDMANGQERWQTTITDLYDAELYSEEHGLLVAHKVVSPQRADAFCPEFLWIDAATGEISARWTVADLTESEPQFGPLLRHNDRVWTFYATRHADPHRDLIELQPQGKAETITVDRRGFDPWLRHTRDELREPIEERFPQWGLLSAASRDGFGFIADIHGEKDVVALPAQVGVPIVLAREIKIPASGQPRLRLRFGNDPSHNWQLIIRHGEKVLHEEQVEWAKEQQVWKDRTINLKPAAGQSGWLTIEAKFVSHGDHTRTFWKRISVEF